MAIWIPYFELARLDKPVGIFYCYLPCLIETLAAASRESSTVSLSRLLMTNIHLLVASALFRGAGCTLNDILDSELDQKVVRTRNRPIARGAISVSAASAYFCVELSLLMIILDNLSTDRDVEGVGPCVLYTLPFIGVDTLYPLAKRFTNYPPILLGLAFSWGIVVAFPALRLDIFYSNNFQVAGLMILSNIV